VRHHQLAYISAGAGNSGVGPGVEAIAQVAAIVGIPKGNLSVFRSWECFPTGFIPNERMVKETRNRVP